MMKELVSVEVAKVRAELEEHYRIRELERALAMEQLKDQLLKDGK